MWPSSTEMAKPAASSRSTPEPSTTNLIQRSQVPIAHPKPSLKINDFIEARSSSAHSKEKFSGRIGLKVLKENEPYLIMSTHIITEAIVAKSSLRSMFGRSRHRIEKLNEEWNDHVDIWAGNEKVRKTCPQPRTNIKACTRLVGSTDPSTPKQRYTPMASSTISRLSSRMVLMLSKTSPLQ